MRYPRVSAKKVVITGCSTGIGAAAALILRRRGWQVIPTARKPVDLEALRTDGFTPVALDLANPDSVAAATEEILETLDGEVGAVVNNAGFGQPGAVEDLTRDALLRQFEVNVFGLVQFTNAFIPTMRRQGCGRIVNISSVLGRVATPFVGAYCASKFALEALSDALRVELRGTGVAVSVIEPGPIVSAFRRTAAAAAHDSLDVETSRFGDMYKSEVARRADQAKKTDLFTRPPEAVAVKIAHALESPRPRIRYCVTIPAYAGALVRRFMPDPWLDRVLSARAK